MSEKTLIAKGREAYNRKFVREDVNRRKEMNHGRKQKSGSSGAGAGSSRAGAGSSGAEHSEHRGSHG